MNSLLQYKDVAGSGVVKDVSLKSRVVTGYLSKFGNVDHDGDIIHPGAFKRSISHRFKELRFLNQHIWSQPHGRFAVIKEDPFGLYFESEPLIETSYSMDALKLYDAGIISQHSIGFKILDDEFDHKTNIRNIKEVKLYEGSNVTLGANPETPFLGFKSTTASIEESEKLIKSIMQLLRHGDLSDDGFSMLEFALKTLQRQSYELGKKARTESGPPPAPGNETASLLDIINNYN